VTGEAHPAETVTAKQEKDAGAGGANAPDRYHYYEGDPETGEVKEVRLGPGEKVVTAKSASGKEYPGSGFSVFKHGKRVFIGDPNHRMAVFDRGTWDIVEVAPEPTASDTTHGTDALGRELPPPRKEPEFYQSLRQDNRGNVDLLTYKGRRPPSASGGAKNDQNGDGNRYYDLDGEGSAGWYQFDPFGGAPKVDRIITAPGRRLDGKTVEQEPAVLVRNPETGRYEPIMQIASGGKGGDSVEPAYYRVGPDGRPERVEFSAERSISSRSTRTTARSRMRPFRLRRLRVKARPSRISTRMARSPRPSRLILQRHLHPDL
jgi:hypothetical protein